MSDTLPAKDFKDLPGTEMLNTENRERSCLMTVFSFGAEPLG
ncbi:protein of unknown function [Streptantibioticus cattleyicolor NRRL 8057 = DSM 46488]|nr:protein of unknown function [Streptantibioticus cattleyicolor NRRL 8057 = DSM 46488]